MFHHHVFYRSIIGLMLLQPLFSQGEVSAQQSMNTRHNSQYQTYNFAYKIAGDKNVAPVQVFDNGSRIYIQFRDMTVLPAIFADTPLGEVLMKPGVAYDIEPPYVTIRNIEPELILVLNKRKATVSYRGPITEFISKASVMYGAKDPISVSKDAILPIAPDAFVQNRQSAQLTAANRMQNDPPLSIPASPVEAIDNARNPAVKQKVSSSATEVQGPSTATKAPQEVRHSPLAVAAAPYTVVPPQPPLPTWEIKADDGSILAALTRWSTQSHWQLAWDVPGDYPTEIQDQYTGSFEDAVRRVMDAFKISAYPPWPCFHENHVLRIVRRVQGDNSECLR